MKTKILILILIIATVCTAFAQEPKKEQPFLPVNPEIIGQGGSFTAVAHGYGALFTNPAGFARKNGALTIASVTPWIYAQPMWLLEDLSDLTANPATPGAGKLLSDAIEKQIVGYYKDVDDKKVKVDGNGFGVGASGGISFVGNGIGLGLITTEEVFIQGKTWPLGVQADAKGDLTFIGGLALPVDLFGMKLYAGADVRASLQLRTKADASTVVGLLKSSMSGSSNPVDSILNLPTLNGFGLAFDAGLILESGSLSLGLAVRDLFGSKIDYSINPLIDVVNTLAGQGGLPEKLQIQPYAVPTQVNFGLAFHPDFGVLKILIDPTIHAEVSDILGMASDKSVWKHVHVGAEVRVLSFIAVRAGLNQGYMTAGLGLRLLILDLNVAVFSRELGVLAGDYSSSGMTAEVALRI